MTDYAYKLVSLVLGGQPDMDAIKRANDRGWEPVPVDELPDPVPTAGMTPDQLANFKLCRMPRDKRDAMVAERERLNKALGARATQIVITLFKVHNTWPAVGYLLWRDIVGYDDDENPIWEDVYMTTEDLEGTKLAYDWLSKRGLA